MGKLYIAYGSNLCKRQMRMRCPGARPVGKFVLTKAKLVFRGVADVEYDPNSSVPCGLWMITGEDERKLDSYEGVNSGTYYKEESIVLRYQGKPQNALIYLMNSGEEIHPPSAHYVETIRKGYKDFGLDETYLDAAIRHSFEAKQLGPQTTRRRERQRNNWQHRDLVKPPAGVKQITEVKEPLKILDQTVMGKFVQY